MGAQLERKVRSVRTRFRAYRLGAAGSSFSYYADGCFKVIEGRLTDISEPQLLREMAICNVSRASCLHITSWDQDHCAPGELQRLLQLTKPATIECPGYEPQTDCAKQCQNVIRAYRLGAAAERSVAVKYITPEFICGLGSASDVAFSDIFYHPRVLSGDNCNDNSTVKLLRSGIFNVLSLGDLENPSLAKSLARQRILKSETDVMILAHHGADNGFTDRDFLRAVRPRIAICSSNRENQHDHPRDEIRRLLQDEEIPLCTTKGGDVIVESLPDEKGGHTGRCLVKDLMADSEEIREAHRFTSKKARLLGFNADTLRQIYAPRPQYPRR